MPSKRTALSLPLASAEAARADKNSEAEQRLLEVIAELSPARLSPEATATAAGLTADELAARLRNPQFVKQIEAAAELAVPEAKTLKPAAAVFLHGFMERANQGASAGTLDPDEELSIARIAVKLLERDDRIKAAEADPYADLPTINFIISDSLRPGWTPSPGYVEAEPPCMAMEFVEESKPAPATRTAAPGLPAMDTLLSGDFEALPLDGEDAP